MAPEVGGDDAIAVGQHREGREPVELRGRHQPVHEEQHRRAGRALHLVDERVAPARYLEHPPGRARDGRELADRKAQKFEHLVVPTPRFALGCHRLL